MSDRADVSLAVGETIRIVVELTDADGTPVDVTGSTGLASELRTEPGGALISTGTVTLSDPTNGEISVIFSDTDTLVAAPGQYRYDLWVRLPTGDRRRILFGIVTLEPSVTVAGV